MGYSVYDQKEGGLEVIDCMIWNEATITKYVWNIANKADNIWVKWVNPIYLKGAEWWQYNPPKDSCLYWKQICNVKKKFVTGLSLPVTARSKVDIHESKRKANKGVGGEKCGTKQMSQNIALFTVWQCIEGF